MKKLLLLTLFTFAKCTLASHPLTTQALTTQPNLFKESLGTSQMLEGAGIIVLGCVAYAVHSWIVSQFCSDNNNRDCRFAFVTAWASSWAATLSGYCPIMQVCLLLVAVGSIKLDTMSKANFGYRPPLNLE